MQKLLDIAKEAATRAGEYLKASNGTVENENGKDIKLVADKESEAIILSVLSRAKVPILAEEGGKSEELSGVYYVVDPLDGSMNFTKGLKELTCISIAIMKDNKPVAGVVYRYFLNEMFWGLDGVGAFCNDMPIYPSKVEEISRAVLATGFPVFRDYSEKGLSVFIHQAQNFKKVRMLGAAALMGSFVAAGRIDVYMEEDIMLWDVVAAVAIVKAAGGTTELQVKDGYRCTCRLYSNHKLLEDYKRINDQVI